MIIAQISDTHLISVSSKFKVIAESRIKYLENCVSNILGLRPQPDAIIHTGDISHNGLIEEYRLAFKILNRLNSPIIFTPGNRADKKILNQFFRIILLQMLKGINLFTQLALKISELFQWILVVKKIIKGK